MTNNMSRRSVAKGAAWSIPAIQIASTAPAVAASSPGGTFTGTNDKVYDYLSRYYRVPSTCSTTNLNSGGFLDTQGCTPNGGPVDTLGRKSGDCLLNPNSSIGMWIETTNATSGTAQICNVTRTYTFSAPIAIDSCPNGTYNNDPGATWKWTECTTLNGWTYSLSADGKTLTLKYNQCATVQTSTGANGTGTYLPGYFINYHFTTICPTSSTTIQWTTTATWYDKTYPAGTTFTKSTTAASVV